MTVGELVGVGLLLPLSGFVLNRFLGPQNRQLVRLGRGSPCRRLTSISTSILWRRS